MLIRPLGSGGERGGEEREGRRRRGEGGRKRGEREREEEGGERRREEKERGGESYSYDYSTVHRWIFACGAACTWLVSGLFNELEVKLIAESFLLQTLLYGQLHHGDTVICIHLFKTNPTRRCDTCGGKVFPYMERAVHSW